MQDVVVIPHVGLGGGAGMYISQCVKVFKKYDLNVVLYGPHARDYSDFSDCFFDGVNGSVLPNYSGIPFIVSLYHFIRTIFLVPFFLYGISRISLSGKVIVFTSSVQALNVFFVKLFFRPKKVVILVQENWIFNNAIGFITRPFFKGCDGVVSISRYWSDQARKVGIYCFIFPNFYDIDPSAFDFKHKHYDFIYVGGGGRIKGFGDFVEFIKRLGSIGIFRIVALGYYDEDQLKLIRDASRAGPFFSDVNVVGLVSNPLDYIANAKVLLLPIASPHFCRPAIEAGFFHSTFLIKNHVGISDFAEPGVNCLAYSTIDEMIDIAIQLINSERLRFPLEHGNYVMSKFFIATESTDLEFMKFILN